jgi:hypothetical protein
MVTLLEGTYWLCLQGIIPPPQMEPFIVAAARSQIHPYEIIRGIFSYFR